jgi:hypothetical protein
VEVTGQLGLLPHRLGTIRVAVSGHWVSRALVTQRGEQRQRTWKHVSSSNLLCGFGFCPHPKLSLTLRSLKRRRAVGTLERRLGQEGSVLMEGCEAGHCGSHL